METQIFFQKLWEDLDAKGYKEAVVGDGQIGAGNLVAWSPRSLNSRNIFISRVTRVTPVGIAINHQKVNFLRNGKVVKFKK